MAFNFRFSSFDDARKNNFYLMAGKLARNENLEVKQKKLRREKVQTNFDSARNSKTLSKNLENFDSEKGKILENSDFGSKKEKLFENLDSEKGKKLENFDSEKENLLESSDFDSEMGVDSDSALHINVGGNKHLIRNCLLTRFPKTMLGIFVSSNHENRMKFCHLFFSNRAEYFFDRSSTNFDAILNLYRTGQLHISPNVCVEDFLEELRFWQIPITLISPCCIGALPPEILPDLLQNFKNQFLIYSK